MPLAMILWKLLQGLALLLLLVAAALALLLAWAAGGQDAADEAKWRSLGAEQLLPGDPPEAGERLTVLSWNMAYGRGPVDDAGDLRDEATVRDYLTRIAEAIVRSGADIVALQEVDFDAARTHHIDQLRFLAERTGLAYAARCTTWQNRYVPYPFWPASQHYGAMHSGQAVLSRFPLEDNGRLRFAQPESNPFWYNWFYLHRASQLVSVRLDESRRLRLVNTHLEAFDLPNREAQATRLAEFLREREQTATLLLGDFNALPPEAAKKRDFADEPDQDFTQDRSISILRDATGYGEVVHRDAGAGPGSFTFPAEAPTRQLDHLFFSPELELLEGGVWEEAGAVSDHLPIRAVLLIRK